MELEKLSPEVALPRMKASLDAGRPCLLWVTGTSMVPILREGRDAVILVPLERAPRRGDILFYLRPGNHCIIHRVHKVCADGSLRLCGDAQTALEPVYPAQFLALVSHIKRPDGLLDCRSVGWRFKCWLWMATRPVRPFVFRAVGVLRRFIKKK